MIKKLGPVRRPKVWSRVFYCLLISCARICGLFGSLPAYAEPSSAMFENQVRPILNRRCVACHSCFDSPCQLSLQSQDALFRGAFHENVYNGSRLKPVAPTRIYEDARTEEGWRALGFWDVLGHPTKISDQDSIFLRMVDLAVARTKLPSIPVRQNLVCVRDERELASIEKSKPEFAMPYGFPPLTKSERDTLANWVLDRPKTGFSALTLNDVAKSDLAVVRDWEALLNQSDLKHAVVARYLFEHFFLAHFYFPGNPKAFLKLVRSKTSCDAGIDPIHARRPNSNPDVKSWFYCFYKDPATIVYKNHIPYELSQKKLSWLKENFFGSKWEATAFPSFEDSVAGNPFVAFKEIPLASRYRFLLEDARYHVMTFIKGPVCDGSIAVNVIQEQFYIFFMEPQSDPMVRNAGFAKASERLLVLPGALSDGDNAFKILSDYESLARLRDAYREQHNLQLEKQAPLGLRLSDLWNGYGSNPNAVLTVFRHDDNADVAFGPKGDLAKTIFVLDYSIFERLVYNLVVNFDVFGSVRHQGLTRLYMDLLRMEAEDNYLEFLPKEIRLALKKTWYQGSLTGLKLRLLDENRLANIPSAITLPGVINGAGAMASGPSRAGATLARDPLVAHQELVQKIVFERLSAKVRGPDDVINWKKLKENLNLSDPEFANLRKIAAVAALDSNPFARFFPELSLVYVDRGRKAPRVYSFIHNREHENVSWMFGENKRLLPGQDTLTIEPDVLGGYPNQFFRVDEKNLPQFVLDVAKITSDADYQRFVKTYGVTRNDPAFWSHYDVFNFHLTETKPFEAGVLDLSRFAL